MVIESISTKQQELKLKTMYFENGDLRDNEAIKSIERLLSDKTPRNPLVQKPNNHLDNTHLTIHSDLLQNAQKEIKNNKGDFRRSKRAGLKC